jgi:hypothetical protein
MFKHLIWNHIFFDKDGGSGGEGSGDSGGDPGGAGGGGDGGNAGGAPGASSLRAQLAAGLDETERASFAKWADSYTTDKDFAKAAVSMRSNFDSRVPIPKPDDKPEVIDGFWQKVGKPKEAKEYAFDWGKDEEGKPRVLDDEMAGFFEGFKEHSHKVHKTKAQFEEDLKFYNDFEAKREASMKGKISAGLKAAETRLKQDWGPDYEDNLAFAQDAGADFADDEKEWTSFVNLQLADGVRIGDHPTLLRMMAKIGRANADDRRVRRMNDSGEAESIKAKIEEIENEALAKGKSTSSEEYHKRLQPLYEKLYPKKHAGAVTGVGFGGKG